MTEIGPVNQTMLSFGYPDSAVAQYRHWAVLLRPQQATLGALILVCREQATAFSSISPAAAAELPSAIRDIERALGAAFAYDKINYLMLMMVDPHVHFHVLPRYAGPRDFAGIGFTDPGWPRLPDLAHGATLPRADRSELIAAIRAHWESDRS